MKGGAHMGKSVLISATILLTISRVDLWVLKRWVVVDAGGVNVKKRVRGKGGRVGKAAECWILAVCFRACLKRVIS